MRIKLTGSQSAVIAPLLTDYGTATVKATVLVIEPDSAAPTVLDRLRSCHAVHTGSVGERRALAIAIGKLDDATASYGPPSVTPVGIPAVESSAEETPDSPAPLTPEETPAPSLALSDSTTTESRAREADALGLPNRLTAVLRAIGEGGYGAQARGLLRDTPQRSDETPTRWVARLRHALYISGHNRAGDALQTIGGK